MTDLNARMSPLETVQTALKTPEFVHYARSKNARIRCRSLPPRQRFSTLT